MAALIRLVGWCRLLPFLGGAASGAIPAEAAAQPPTITLTLDRATLAEGAGNTNIGVTATLSQVRASDTIVALSLGGDARATDYAIAGSLPRITIPANRTAGEATLLISAVNDIFFEATETVEVNGIAGNLLVIGASLVIEDDETQPSIRVTVNPRDLEEGKTSELTVTVSLDGDVLEDDLEGQLDLSFSGGLEAADVSFDPPRPWRFTVQASQGTAIVIMTASAVDDVEAEINPKNGNFVASAVLHGAPLTSGSGRTSTFRVLDNDTRRRLEATVSPENIKPGESTTVTVTFRVLPALTENFTFTFRASDADQRTWFSPSEVQVTIPAGDTSQARTFTVTPPATAPPTAVFFEADIEGETPVQKTLASITVDSLEAPRVLQDLRLTSWSGRNGLLFLKGGFLQTTVQFDRTFAVQGGVLRLQLDSGPRDAACWVSGVELHCDYRIQYGDYDFDGLVSWERGALTFAWSDSSDSTITWPVPVLPQSAGSAMLPYPMYGGDNAIDLRVSPESVQEGVGATSLTITAQDRLGIARTTALEVPLRFADSTTTPADYSVTGPLSVTIPAGGIEGRTTVTLTPVEDFAAEARIELVRIEGSMDALSNFVRGADLQILDSPSIVLSASLASIAENGGAQQVTLTAAFRDPLDQVRPRPIPVALSLAGTAVEGDDFAWTGDRSVTIPSNARSGMATVTVTPIDDRLLEMDETLELRGFTPGLPVLGTQLTLQDDETAPQVVLAIDDATLRESEPGAAAVTVTASLASSVVVDAATLVTLDLGGSATAGSSGDYTAGWSPVARQITIPAESDVGTAPVTLTLTLRDDHDAEGDETIVVEGVAEVMNPAMDDLVVQVATITLLDDDVPGVVVEPTSLTIYEGDSSSYAVRLATRPASEVKVAVAVPADAPLQVAPAILTFTPQTWSADQQLTVTVDEAPATYADVQLTHSVAGGGYAGVMAPPVTVTVRERTVPRVSIENSSGSEDGGPLAFAVVLDRPSLVEVRVDWATAAGTATAGADYSESNGTVTFPPGSVRQALTVGIVDDELDELDESFRVTLSDPEGAEMVDSEATGTIVDDDDDEPELTLRGPSNPTEEATGASVVFTVTLSAESGREVTVGYATEDATATAPADFRSPDPAATLTFDPGDTSGTIAIAVVDDDLHEGEETFAVRLQMADGATVATGLAEGRITDNDDPPALGVSDVRVTEDAGELEFAVTLDAPSGLEVTLDYATSDGTATEPEDYREAAGSLTFAAGETQKTLLVEVVDDLLDEADETLTLTLSDAQHAGFTGGGLALAATGTIADDDPVPTVQQVADVTAAEDAGALEFTVTLDAPSGREVTLDYATSDGTATAPGDYAVTLGVLTLSAGRTSGTIEVPIVDDDMDEPEEEFTLTLNGADHVGLVGGVSELTATGTIVDDEPTPTVLLALDPAAIDENGGVSAVTASLTGASSEAVTVTVTATPAGDTQAGDFTQIGTTLAIAVGERESTGAVTVTAVDDTLDTPDKTVTVSGAVTGGNGVAAPGDRTLTIRDDEDLVVSVMAEAASVPEGAAAAFVVEVEGGESTAEIVVTYTVGGAASPGVDYEAPAGTLTLPAGTSAGTITIVTLADGVLDPGETLVVTLTGVSTSRGTVAVDPGASSAETEIGDSGMVTVSVASEGMVTEGSPATFTVGLSGAVAVPLTLGWSTSDGTAAAGEDYTGVESGTVTFAAASTAAETLTVATLPDTVAEGEETFTVTLTGSNLPPGVSLGTATATGQIADDDIPSTAVTLAVNPASVSEGSGPMLVTVTATLNQAARPDPTLVRVALVPETASASDFVPVVPFDLTIAAGATTGRATFSLLPDDDVVAEGTETVSVTGTTTVGQLTVTPATLTITDNDVAATGITLALNPATVPEGGGETEVSVTATLDGAARTEATVVTVAVAGGSAAAADFAPVSSFELTIGATEASGTGTFTLAPTDDGVAEGPETVLVTGAASGLTVTPATLTITDNDVAATGITLALNPATVPEGGGETEVSVTATLDGAGRTEAAVVTVAVAGGSAAAADFAPVSSFELTIEATEASGTGTFTLTPTDDGVAEGPETVLVTGAASGLTVTPATLTIADNDVAATGITLALNPATVPEGDGETEVSVTATLDGAARTEATVVMVSVAGGSAAAADFAPVPSFELTIRATEASGTGTFTLAPTDDGVAEGPETVLVTGAAEASGLTVTSAELTIEDNDAAAAGITLTVDPATVSEGAGEEEVAVTATLDGAARTEATVVTVSVAGGSAAAADFAPVSSFEVRIGATEASGTGTFTLAPTDDGVAEGPETVLVTGAAGLTVTSAELTIEDNDAAAAGITLTVDPATVSEGAGEEEVAVTATLDGAARTEATVVTVSVAGGSADAADFAPVPSFELTIGATEASGTGTFTLTPTDDGVAEGPETVLVTGAASGLTVAPAELTIVDNDVAATGITLALNPATVPEGDGETEVSVTATLDGTARTEATVVTVAVAGGSAAAADFAPVSSFEVTIGATEASGTGTFTLAPTDDGVAEGPETVLVTGAAEGLTVAPAELTIVDNDMTAAGITLTVDPATVSEGAGEEEVAVTATLDGAARTEATVVTVSVAGGSADAADFAPVPSFEVTIGATEASGTGTFTLAPTDDGVAEGPETVLVTGAAEASGLTVTPAELTIADNDPPDGPTRDPTMWIDLSVVPDFVMEDAGPAELRVTATLEGGVLSEATMVTVIVEEDQSGERYAVAPAVHEIEIPAGQASGMKEFMLMPIADATDETDELVAITGTNAPDGMTVTGTAVIIRDDDEVNVTPGFDRQRYVFYLPENHDGRRHPLVLGRVRARDSDGDPLRYSLASGDRERFTVGTRDGAVTYVGPGEDFEGGPREYELRVDVRDGSGGTRASAQVIVKVTDEPEPPVAVDDRVETPEDTPVEVDVLANDRDPDGGRLRVASVGAAANGTVTLKDGRVKYAPDRNWYGEDRFPYTVSNRSGLTATATVKVTVTPVNDPPEAVDDEAQTWEELPVVVDVLANDTDVEGSPLRLVAVGAAEHGTASLTAGGVRYVPALNYFGPDRFIYTIADPEGLEGTATVTMTVLPVNDAPEAVGLIPDQQLEEGGDAATVDLTPFFTDVDGDVLVYEAASSDETAVLATVSGATLTLSPVVTGTALVRVTARDAEDLAATQTFGVTVGHGLVRGVLTDTLAALGRGHLSSARLTIGRRLEAGGSRVTRIMLAGQQFSLDAWERMGAGGLRRTHEMLLWARLPDQRRAAPDLLGTMADPGLWWPRVSGLGGRGIGDRWLQATDLLLPFGADDGAPGGGGRWSVWGQGDIQTFRAGGAGTSGYDGDLRSAYLGVDTRLSETWLAGVAVARSSGTGNWRLGSSGGVLTTGLTSAYPYLRWRGRQTAVWAVLGVGRGTVENERTMTGRRGTAPMALDLGLLEGRRELASVAGLLELVVRAEASWARLRTGAGPDTVNDLEAEVGRVRTGLEVAWPIRGPGGLLAAPFGAMSTRYDGGAGQTGLGLEVGGGLRVTGRAVRIEAQGRILVLHTATDYSERGASVTASLGGGQYNPGPQASLRRNWGAPGMGAGSLWQDSLQTFATRTGTDGRGFDTRLGYGLRLPGGLLLAAFGGYGQTGGGRRLQVGANLGTLGLFGGDLDSPVQVEFLGERYDRDLGGGDHRVSLFAIVDFTGRPRRP